MTSAEAVLSSPESSPMLAVAQAVDSLTSDGRQLAVSSALEILYAVATKVSTRELHSLPEVVAWLATISGGMQLVKLLAVLDDEDDDPLTAVMILHLARCVIERAGTVVVFPDAEVEGLGAFLVAEWKKHRSRRPHDWLYHPRKTSLSATTTKKFLSDLLATSLRFKEDAEQGRVACDLNVTMVAGQRHKRLDMVIGRPADAIGVAKDSANPLRKTKVAEPRLTLEIKACMTAHRQATPRLLDELRSSVEVVKAVNSSIIPVALVIINVSPTFTNPLNLPGPNEHIPRDIERLFRKLNERVILDRGSGRETAYGGVGVVVIDTDNEGRILEGPRGERVPSTHTYERAVGRAARLYESRSIA